MDSMNHQDLNPQPPRRSVRFSNDVNVIILKGEKDESKWYSGREIRNMKRDQINLSLSCHSTLPGQSSINQEDEESIDVLGLIDVKMEMEKLERRKRYQRRILDREETAFLDFLG